MNDNEISKIVDEYIKFIIIKREEYKLEFENGEEDYQKLNEKELDKILDKNSKNCKLEKNQKKR